MPGTHAVGDYEAAVGIEGGGRRTGPPTLTDTGSWNRDDRRSHAGKGEVVHARECRREYPPTSLEQTFEPIEDQIEAEFELALLLRASFPEVLLDMLNEVRHLLARQLTQEVACHAGELLV